MAAPNPSMVIFPRIQCLGSYLECRIIRVTNFVSTTNYYDWPNSNPTDVMYLDQRGFLSDDFGDIIKEYRDELSRLRLDSTTFTFNDNDIISGVDASGTPIAEYNLFQDGKTFVTHFFNDRSDSTTYIMWTTLYDSPSGGAIQKITFTGDINKNSLPDHPLLLRNDDNPSQLLRTSTIQMNAVPVWDRLSKYSARDIGIYNHFQDGNSALSISDMNLGASGMRSPFWAGLKGFTNFTDLNPTVPTNVSLGKIGFPGVTDPITSFTNFGSAIADSAENAFFCTYDLTVNSVFGGLTGTNVGGVPVGSFRNGFYGLSLQVIADKVASFIGCDPNVSVASDVTITGVVPKWNDTNKGYDSYVVSNTLNSFNANYNILFGVSPSGTQIVQTIAFDGTVGHQIRVDVDLPSVFFGITDGQQVLIEGAQDPNANGIWTAVNCTTADGITSDFELEGSASTMVGGASGTISVLFSSPVTYSENDKADILIKDICRQFHYKLKFGITQSGANIGMPYFYFVSRWKAGNPIPSTWIQGQMFGRQPRKVSSDCVKVSRLGSTAAVVCPAGAKLTPVDLPPLRWGSHLWGTPKGVYPVSFTFNGDRAAFGDINTGQMSTSYTGDNIQFPLDDDGWIAGSFLYFKTQGSDNTRYPPVFANRSNQTTGGGTPGGPTGHGGFTATDWDGFMAYNALAWYASLPAGVNPSEVVLAPFQDNALFDIARLAYLELIENQELYKRDFARVFYTDDLDLEYEDSWQEGGVQVKYRMTRLEYSQIDCKIKNSDWEQSPPDYSSLDSVPACIFLGGKNDSAGAVGGSFGSGNTSNPSGNFIEKSPAGLFSNTITPKTDTGDGLRITTHSLTQSEVRFDFGLWDGTTYTQQGGINPLTGFFTKTQVAFEIKSDTVNTGQFRFYNTANTHYTALKAAGTITADVTFTLPSADGSNGFVLQTNGSGALSWVDPATFLTNAVITNPSTVGRNLIQSTANNTSALQIKGRASESVPHFVVTNSSGTNQFNIDNTSANFYDQSLWILEVAGRSAIGLVSAGPSLSFGNSGDYLTSGGPSGALTWTTPTGVSAAVILNPLTDGRNFINPSTNDAVGLTIQPKASGVKNLLVLNDNGGTNRVVFGSDGVMYAGDQTAISGTTVGSRIYILQQTSGIGLYLKMAGTTPADLMRWTSSADVVLGKIDSSGTLFSQKSGIGATTTDGIVLQNLTAAAAGAQQWSPRTHWIAQGWKTASTAASQQAEWIAEVQSVQGTANPTGDFVLSSQINGGGWIERFRISSLSCVMSINGSVLTSGVVTSVSGVLTGNSPASNSIFFGTSSTSASFNSQKITYNDTTTTLKVGVAGSSTGHFQFTGATSGTITITPGSAAGTYTALLPDMGHDANFLLTNLIGANANMGQATLVGGTVLVTTTYVVAGSIIFVSPVLPLGANTGVVGAGGIVANTSFRITSTNVLDNNVINYIICNP